MAPVGAGGTTNGVWADILSLSAHFITQSLTSLAAATQQA